MLTIQINPNCAQLRTEQAHCRCVRDSAWKLAREPALPLVRIIIGQQTCSARVPASADSAAQLYSHARILLLVDLDVAFGDESSVAVREIRTGDADEKRVLAGTSLAIVTGVDVVVVARLLIDFGTSLKRCTVP